MSIADVCGLNIDLDENEIGFTFEKMWNGHQISIEENGIVCSIKGYSKQGWGKIKQQIKPMGVGGSVKGKKDSDGESTLSAEVHASSKDDNGNKISVEAEGRVKSDADGHVKTEGEFKFRFDKDF